MSYAVFYCLVICGFYSSLNFVTVLARTNLNGKGMLYPRDSESRQSKLLDGIWNFRADFSPSRNEGFSGSWWDKPLSQTGPVQDMPVPASYNDVTEDKALRDFVGWVWYDRTFFVDPKWEGQRIVLRIDSAHYYAMVWVNGMKLIEHDGGHLPFEAETQTLLNKGVNRVTVAVNNTLTPTTLPPGTVQYQTDTTKYPPGYFVQNLQMDFFNYAGIHRHVRLYTTPLSYIDDISIVTQVSGTQGIVHYNVTKGGPDDVTDVSVTVLDASGQPVAKSSKFSDQLTISSPNLWWPFAMHSSVGYQYTLEVNMSGDVYRQPFGIRTVRVTADKILINEKPFYCQGVAKHEDADLRGKGLDYTLITKDFNMLRWLGVNCIRTSHYPYAEEILHLADSQGVAVIDESPGVGIQVFNLGNVSLQHHLEVMTEMVRRDKNKPSVIMWSVANEPSSNWEFAVPYFKAVIAHTRAIDPAQRPITFACSQSFESDKVSPFVDVISINRYYGWYTDSGHMEVIQPQLQRELSGFRKRYAKPIIITEYGADTIPGLHREPTFMFTEDFQVEFLSEYHKVYDKVRTEYLAGEMVWNFADFMTVEGVTRVNGNKKGLLTRQRQPKRSAFLIRERYHALASGRDPSYLYSSSFKYSSQAPDTHLYFTTKSRKDEPTIIG